MIEEEYFDHILGEQHRVVDPNEVKMLKRIIKAHAEDYSEEEKMDFQRIGLHLRMKRYLSESNDKIISVGAFLNELLIIYQLKKVKFAKLIQYENTNLHALLKGRRKINNKLAIKIGSLFSIDPELWMMIETKNELAKCRADNQGLVDNYNLEQLKSAR